MRTKTIIFLLVLKSSLFSQTISWWSVNNNLEQPVQVLAFSPKGALFAGSNSTVYILDSSNVWSYGGNGISNQLGFGINAIGFSHTAQFISFNKTKTLYRSTDNGKSWQLSVTGLVNPYIKKMLSSNDTIFGMPTTAFYRSTDNGVTWSLAYNGLTTSNFNRDLLRLTNGTLLLATSKGIFRSTNNAGQWSAINFFTGKNCAALEKSPTGSIIAAADTSFFVSTDDGDTWNDLGINNWQTTKIVYADSSLFLLTGLNVYRLKNNVISFASDGLVYNGTSDIAVAPNGSLYASNYNKGVYVWNLSQKKWELLQTGFRNVSIPVVASELGIDYAGVKGKGLFYSVDKGTSWNMFLADSKNSKAIYLSNPHAIICDSAAIYRTTDKGTTWQSLNPVVGKGAISIAKSGNTIFVGVQDNGVYVSTNNGNSWEVRNNGIGNQTVVSLLNMQTNVLLAGTSNGIYKTTDAGNMWTKLGSVSSITTLFRNNNGNIFAGTNDGIYRSVDGGGTWTKTGSLSGTVTSITSPGINAILVASSSDGIFISTNLGISWKKNSNEKLNSMVWTGLKIFASSSDLKYGTFSFPISSRTKWLTIGSLQNWFADIGSEPEAYRTGKDYGDGGWCYPAIRPFQDMQVSKGLWIGYDDPLIVNQIRKKVIQVGPRNYGVDDFIPYKFLLISNINPPTISVSNIRTYNKDVEIDFVDGLQKADRVIENAFFTSSGIEGRRKIRQFSQQFHDNYIVTEYTFVNPTSTTFTGLYFYFTYRWGINIESAPVIGFPIVYGKNTMIDMRGDGQNPVNPFFGGNKDNDIRSVYGWHGFYPAFSGGYDNIGGPIWKPYYDKSDSVGRLGAPQFVGVATLHADKSSKDSSDDIFQPSTISYEESDGYYMSPTISSDSAIMFGKYNVIAKGRTVQRHADKVGTNGDPALGTSGGLTATLGFGPYTIESGDSVCIVLAEAAASVNEETAVNVGKQYKSGLITAKQKNSVVYTGRDSLFQTFRRALANYNSGYAIPQPPVPPKTFTVQAAGNKILLQWTTYSDNDPKLSGFEIYRTAEKYYARYEKVFSCNASVRLWIDSTGKANTSYFYYIVSVGRNSDNTGVGGTPFGNLQSSRYYTQTYDPIYIVTSVGSTSELPIEFSLNQNYPNPFNPTTTISYSIPQTLPEFKTLAGLHVTLKVYDVVGREVATLVNEMKHAGNYSVQFNGSKYSSGIYFYTLKAGNFTAIKKLLLLK